MSRSSRPQRQQANPLEKWLALDWRRPERSYNPDVRDFLAGLLDYPKDRVVTEDTGGGGYPDIKLLTTEKIAWVVGDLKKDDAELNTESGRRKLWNQKRKYVEGLTRYVLFLTARYLWLVLPTGETVVGFENPCNLSEITFEELREKLKFLSYKQATHRHQWATFIDGQLPYVYLKLDTAETLARLRQDLQTSFAELGTAAEQAITTLIQQYEEFKRQEQEIQRNLVDTGDTQRRALVRLRFKFDFHRHLFDDILPRFEDQYGRDVNAKGKQVEERIRESFIADSVAVLVARVLFLRLVEDLELTKKRRLSNGGPQDWAAFVDQLTGDAKALVRFKPSKKPADIPQIHVYNLNSLLRESDLVPLLGKGFLAPGSSERDSEQWKYIVGNPPYIRAERVKYGDEIKGLWQQVWGQNADTGLVFLYRALTESLQSGGFLGMVVSGGYANSEAAAKVWKLLYPRREAALRKIVWLEFAGKQWDANVIPMLLIIEKTSAQEDDEIELFVPSTWLSNEPPAKVKYKDFFDAKVNPRVTEIAPSNPLESLWGNYLLPLLHSEDVPILKKLYSNGNSGNVVELKEAVAQQLSRNNRPFWFTYGIQRGGTEVTAESTGTNSVQVIAGRSISMGWAGESVGWVNLNSVRERQYGKLSLWANQTHESFLVIAKFTLAPTAAVVSGSSKLNLAAVDTIIVALPKSNGVSVEAVAAYLNSKLARFYWATRLRSGVLEGSSRATFYPRTLEALPWVRNLDSAIEQRLVNGYNELARLAATAKNNPNEWLLSKVEARIETSRYKLSDRNLGLNFSNWSPEDVQAEELSLDGNCIRAGLFSLELIDADVAELVYKLLTLNADEETAISRAVIHKLLVPQDYTSLMQNYRQQFASFQQVESDFFAVLTQINETVYEMFEMSDDEKTHIETRLASFPLNKLQPRYPWQTVKPRPIKAYTSDRFV